MSEWAKHLLDDADREPWQAEITRARCPWLWYIHITQGLLGFMEDPIAFGTRNHAEAVARRKLRRLERADRRRADGTTITGSAP